MEFQFAANRFITDWIKPRKFLDLACGNCQLMDYAESKGCSVTGVDINPQKKHVMKHDLNKKLPFPDRSFDTISCIDSLEHVKHVSHVFTEAHRLLKDNGIFIVTVPNTRWYKNHNHLSFFTYQYLLRLIEYSGFEIEDERHFVGLPRSQRYFVFKKIPAICFHYIFKLRKK